MGHGMEACEHTTDRGGGSRFTGGGFRFRGGGAWMYPGLPWAWGWWEDPMQKTPGRWPPQHGKHWARRFPEAARRQTGRWLVDKELRSWVISTRQRENTTVYHVFCRHCQLISSCNQYVLDSYFPSTSADPRISGRVIGFRTIRKT